MNLLAAPNLPVILVTGVPGSGKSTVSRILAEKLGGEVIEVNIFAIEKGLVVGADEDRGVQILDIDGLRTALRRELSERDGWVIVSTTYPEAVPADHVSFVVVLRCNPEALAGRLLSRKYEKPKVIENLEAEIVDFCGTSARHHLPGKPLLEVDTSRISPEEVADGILEAIRKEVVQSPPIRWPRGPLVIQRLKARDP